MRPLVPPATLCDPYDSLQALCPTIPQLRVLRAPKHGCIEKYDIRILFASRYEHLYCRIVQCKRCQYANSAMLLTALDALIIYDS